MQATARLLCCCLALAVVAVAGEPDDIASVRSMEKQRLAATVESDTAKLARLLSDDLRYAYSDGREQTKAQFLAAVASNRIQYAAIEPEELELQAVAPGAVAVHGRARFTAMINRRSSAFTVRFLAIWRQEAGHWRLLAYQSSQLAPTR